MERKMDLMSLFDLSGKKAIVTGGSGRYGRQMVEALASAGATDARRYEQICPVCLRCSPFFIPKEDEGGVHGTNERILVRSYLQGIRVLIDLMETTLG